MTLRAPEEINTPTDLKWFNNAREKREAIIDPLHRAIPKGTRTPGTCRQKAVQGFLKVSKSRKARQKTLRQAIRKQRGYLSRNLNPIEKQNQIVSLSKLSHRQYKNLLVISEVCRRQQWMHDHKSRRIDDRIAIEGKFGQGKRRYRPGRIMTKLDHTRKTAIVMSFLVMKSGKRVEGRLFVSFTPASRSLWPLFSGLYLRAYKKNCDNLDVLPLLSMGLNHTGFFRNP
jgi:hypothetical protein